LLVATEAAKPFRAQLSAAPLKPAEQEQARLKRERIPRSIERGPVEAGDGQPVNATASSGKWLKRHLKVVHVRALPPFLHQLGCAWS
jgi:hypothetical protein